MPSIKSATLLVATILLVGLTANSSIAKTAVVKTDKQVAIDEVKLRQYEKGVDSLLLARAGWKVLDTTNLATEFLGDEVMIKSDIPDSVFIKRRCSCVDTMVYHPQKKCF
jgi:hypothetical protein